MALNAKKALAASKSYTDETVLGGGALKGKNCVINSITDIAETSQKPAGKRVTFGWTLDDGTAQTGTMDVYNGENGQGIDRMYVNEEGHLVVVYDNGTEEDVGEITIPSFQADWNETDPLENSYIKNKPTIPAAQVNSDWDAVSGVAEILHKPTIPTKVSELQNDSGFEANAIESISVNGTAVAPDANKNVNIVVQGGGGTSDYSDLTNKPSINNVTLSGNKTASDLGLATSNDLNTHVATKGDSGVQGHVSLYQGDVSNKTYAQGEAAASAHTHDTRYAPYSVVADVSGKADKVQNAVNGNLAGLDGGGNLTDSGVAASSVVTDVSGKTNLTVIAGVETTTIASKAYAVGDRLVYNGKLYSVTSSIIDGGSIIIEGASANVVETTVDEAINSGSSKVYKHFNITAKSGSIIKLSGFGAFDNDSLGETLLLREKGGETILFAYGSYYGDVNEDSNYIARRFSENATNYITSIVVNKANRDIYVTVASGGDLDVAQIGGIRRDFAYEKNATIPSSNTQTVTIKDVAVGSISGKADKVSNATSGNFAGLDANGNLTDSGKKASDLDDKCDLTNIAKVFTTSDTFSVGDWVFYEGRLYKCTTLHQGAWNSSHFSANRVDQLIPDDMLSLYGRRSSISMSNTSPGKSSISAGGYSFSAFEFDTEYTVSGNEYALYNGLRYIDFDVIMGNDVYRNYKYYDASPYEAEYQSDNTPSYPFFFVVIDPEGYPFAIKMYDINLAAGTFKMKISYLNGYYRNAGEIYLAINSFERT